MSHSALLDQFYAAIKSSDAKSLASCVHPDFHLNWQGSSVIPWAGIWEGATGLMTFFEILNRHIEVLEVSRLHAFSDDQVTVVILRGRWRAKATGNMIEAMATNLFTFQDKLVRSYTVMNNSAAFAASLAL
jgi:uncharacterized protein